MQWEETPLGVAALAEMGRFAPRFSVRKTHLGKTWTKGKSETVHKRPLLNADEIGRLFTRIDDPHRDIYPGLALVLVTGALPVIVRRTLYFQDPLFIGKFGAHPDHGFLPPRAQMISSPGRLIAYLIHGRNKTITLKDWLVQEGDLVTRNQPIARIEGVTLYFYKGKPDAVLRSPFAGIISPLARDKTALGHRNWVDSALPLFKIEYYDFAHNQQTAANPFADLQAAADAALTTRWLVRLALLAVPAIAVLLWLAFIVLVKINEWLVPVPAWLDRISPAFVFVYLASAYGARAFFYASIPAIALFAWLRIRERKYPL